MKRILAVICVSLAALWSVSAVAAESVGVVNMQTIFSSSPQIKKINTQLQSQFSTRKQTIIKMGKDLQAQVKKFQKNQSVMDPKALKALRTKISSQGLQLRQAQQKFQADLQTAQAKKMKGFITKVKMIVKQIAMKKNLEVVLPNNAVLYSKNNLDITNNVLSALKR